MEKNFKIGKCIENIPAIIPTKSGEEKGIIIYMRKAIYKGDPFSSKKQK